MATTRRAEATWSGDLLERPRHGDRRDDPRLRRPADDVGVADRRARGRDEPRGAARRGPRVVLLDGLLEHAGEGRHAADRADGLASTVTADKLERRLDGAVRGASRSAASSRARRPSRFRDGGRGREGRLPDLAGAEGQRRALGRGDARGLSRRRRTPPAAPGSADRQQPPRVVDRDRPDLGVRDAGLAQPRQERLGEVRVAVAAVARQLRVVADVLRQQDPLRVAARRAARRSSSTTRPSPWRSSGVKLIPRKSNSTVAPRSTIARW